MMNGIINVYKEAGFTSHDVVAKMRGILHQKKIGHTGTLDPDATGVLPVCLGKATKLCDVIGNWDKTYRTTLLLGQETDTEDTSGTLLNQSPVDISEDEIRRIILSFQGEYDQVPPMYSAKKVNGKKLYELAREGKVIERKACHVEIKEIVIHEINLPYAEFDVSCSKGTYIRSLCRDIGKKAGCGGCMAALQRLRVSDFESGDALTLHQIEQIRDEGRLGDIVRSIDSVFPFYPRMTVSKEADRLLMNGNSFPIRYGREESPAGKMSIPEGLEQRYLVYDSEHHFIGLYYKLEHDGLMKPDKLFFDL